MPYPRISANEETTPTQSSLRLAALIHDALGVELEAQAERGGRIHLNSVRSLFRQWEFQPSEVHELFCHAAESIQATMNANKGVKIKGGRQHDSPKIRIAP